MVATLQTLRTSIFDRSCSTIFHAFKNNVIRCVPKDTFNIILRSHMIGFECLYMIDNTFNFNHPNVRRTSSNQTVILIIRLTIHEMFSFPFTMLNYTFVKTKMRKFTDANYFSLLKAITSYTKITKIITYYFQRIRDPNYYVRFSFSVFKLLSTLARSENVSIE